jgi:hypothetical protein
MFRLLSRAYHVLKTEGTGTFVRKALLKCMGLRDTFVTLSFALRFALWDRLAPQAGDSILVFARHSTLGPDSLALLEQLPQTFPETKVYLIVDSISEFEASEPLTTTNFEVELELVERHSADVVHALVNSSLLLFTHSGLRRFRTLEHNDRTWITIPHGIITKAAGNLSQSSIEHSTPLNPSLETLPNWYDVQTVASDVELFFRSCARGNHPACFKKYGYPRYDRIERLREGEVTPQLTAAAEETLSDDETFRLLYAPTHKDSETTTLFPLSGFDIYKFKQFLNDHDMELFVRMHPSEENTDFYEEVIDGETILYGGQSFSSSPTEILPAFDALITDYSSIYIDFLPFDRPIIFFKDNHDSYLQERGIAYDYDRYFPGREVETAEEFKTHLQTIKTGDDGFEDDRRFVRNTFLPKQNRTFLADVNRLLNDSSSMSD